MEFITDKPTVLESKIDFNLTPTKTNIQVVSNELAEPVKHGFIDASEFSVRCEFWIKALEMAKKEVQDIAIQNPNSTLGAKVEVVEAGVKYDYSQNENWQIIEMQIKPLREKQKALEKEIALSTKMGKMIIDDDGEVVASPVPRTSTTSLKITLAK